MVKNNNNWVLDKWYKKAIYVFGVFYVVCLAFAIFQNNI